MTINSTRNRRMQDMTATEINTDQVLFVPLGSVEQHGSHMPVDTDSFLATSICDAVAEVVDGIVGPSFTYGCRSLPVSGGGELFPGTISMSGQAFTNLVADLVTTYARHGHRRIVLINGHYENTMFAIEGVKLALEKEQISALVIDWWNILDATRLEEIFNGEFPGWEAEHAGVIETSLMLHVAPSRVQVENIENRVGEVPPPKHTVLPERDGLVDPSGILRTAWGSSAELGSAIFDEIVGTVTSLVVDEFGGPSS